MSFPFIKKIHSFSNQHESCEQVGPRWARPMDSQATHRYLFWTSGSFNNPYSVTQISKSIAKFHKFDLDRVQLNKKVIEIKYETKYIVRLEGKAFWIFHQIDTRDRNVTLGQMSPNVTKCHQQTSKVTNIKSHNYLKSGKSHLIGSSFLTW